MSIASKCPVYPWRTCFSWTSPGQRQKLTDQSRPHQFTLVYHLRDSREQDDNNLVRTAVSFTTQPRSALTFIAQLRLALTFTALFMSFHLLNEKYELCSLMESSPEPSTNGKLPVLPYMFLVRLSVCHQVLMQDVIYCQWITISTLPHTRNQKRNLKVSCYS